MNFKLFIFKRCENYLYKLIYDNFNIKAIYQDLEVEVNWEQKEV